MGGLGSGGHNNKGRGRVEGYHYLDATRLEQFGLLAEGKTSELTWSDQNGVPCNRIRVRSGRRQIRLDYKWRLGDGPWTPHEEAVAIDWNKRHLGGEQPYFFCPRCSSRVKRLYGGTRYLCRSCHNLVHASTQERPGNRATRKNQKLRRKLGVSIALGDWIGPRPKGMHRKTFEKISARIHAAEAEVYDDMLVLLKRMKRTTERRSEQIGRIAGAKDFWR